MCRQSGHLFGVAHSSGVKSFICLQLRHVEHPVQPRFAAQGRVLPRRQLSGHKAPHVRPDHPGRRAAQLALASYLGVLNNEAALLGHLDAAIGGGRSCLAVPVAGGGAGAVCLLPCLRWNYCHDDQSCCTSPARLPLSLTSRGALERAGTAVLHQARLRRGTR